EVYRGRLPGWAADRPGDRRPAGLAADGPGERAHPRKPRQRVRLLAAAPAAGAPGPVPIQAADADVHADAADADDRTELRPGRPPGRRARPRRRPDPTS